MKVLDVRRFEIFHLLLKHIAELEKQKKFDEIDEEYVPVINVKVVEYQYCNSNLI